MINLPGEEESFENGDEDAAMDEVDPLQLDTGPWDSEAPNHEAELGANKDIRDGSLWVVVNVKSCVNKQAGSWSAAQEWTTNQKPDQQVDPTLDHDYNWKISASETGYLHRYAVLDGPRDGDVRDLQRRALRLQGEVWTTGKIMRLM